MVEAIKKAIEVLANKVTENSPPDEALKFTQAALNLAHTLAELNHMNIN